MTYGVDPCVTRLHDLQSHGVAEFLRAFAMVFVEIRSGKDIPGSYWGAPEAGLIENRLYARNDTPIHSILHECCHFLCMDSARRAQLHTDAGGDSREENAVCYLQLVLADRLPGYSQAQCMADMDQWGYSFRLGSARKWFEEDAEDARAWLDEHGLLSAFGLEPLE